MTRQTGMPSLVESIVESCQRLGVTILSPFDQAYPRPLAHIDDYPPLVFVKGELQSLSRPAAAVVGTREASHLGLSWARQAAELLAGANITVVSGLALGIDTAAHEGALRGKGQTVAVLAHGLHTVTPASNRKLATQILDAGGALLSEHPPGTPPRKPEYVRRNRIQSGMSLFSIVVESGEVGGAIHQGNFTRKQKRDLYVMCPPVETAGAAEFKYGGAERLMDQAGAKALRSSQQLRELISDPRLKASYESFIPIVT